MHLKYKWMESVTISHVAQLHVTEVEKKLQICFLYDDAEFPVL